MKVLVRSMMCLCVMAAAVGLRADITVGTATTGNCYPFMCNDSGTSVGQSIDWQEVYAASAFPGTITITDLEFSYASIFGGNATLLGGDYTFYLGTAPLGSVNALSTTLASNYNSGPVQVAHVVVPPGGVNDAAGIHILTTPFTYDPTTGDLLLEVVVSGQDNVGNGSGNGYNDADDTGTVESRAYCLTNFGCFSDAFGPLVTTFSTAAVPEPGTLAMFGSGMIGLVLAGIRRRKKA